MISDMLKILKIYTIIIWQVLAFATEEDFNVEKVKNTYLELKDKRFLLLPHKGNFLLPLSYNHKARENSSRSVLLNEFPERGRYNTDLETEFQISFSINIFSDILGSDYDFYLGYTHHSWWQVYNKNWSRPFRETNYNPEFFFRKVYSVKGDSNNIQLVLNDMGYQHQSNGQIQELSRSWDRIYIRQIYSWKRLLLTLSLWHRMSDDIDDNPDIQRYLGYGELSIDYRFKKAMAGIRIIPGDRYAGAELSYSYPLQDNIRFFTKAFYGYGNSLIDYNNKNRRLGIGFILTDPRTLDYSK
ncbi:MAG: phospholipase A [Bdellovibrionota bacterium]|nr:phospholipase A [Bdellovibrionota bacterium]